MKKEKCKECGKKIGVKYTTSLLAMLPMFVGFILWQVYSSILILLILVMVSFTIYHKWVPLIPKE